MFQTNSNGDTKAVYRLITENADVIKGIFCGHRHNDIYTEVLSSYKDKDGNKVDTFIPQHIVIASAYNTGSLLHIVVD